ncbi:proline-rich receptor-like protein kinase PERK15 [Chenopodium quinoa]|uniref:proline-rich receptor-like protein kinase PERK15 n=1 Tax=Chenopodium quinoa TaxID=63459 RepID=UPI000B78EB34|nr:proline-rich receptor-like protein kinase PERK15 [Chenopodium quinoa]
MSFPAPAASPEIDVGDPTSLPELLPPSPGNDEVTSPPAPSVTLPISVPSLPPVVAPPLPAVVGGTTPPAPSPILSPPLPTRTLPPKSQPQPQQPVSSPPNTPTNIPPPVRTSPPNVISPTPSKPINTNPPQKETPPKKETSPPNIISPPLSKQPDIKPLPPTSNPTVTPSPPSTPTSSQPPVIRPAAQPTPSKPGPLRHQATPTTPRPPSHLPTSAVLPSSPPVALPVPQTPGGGAWIPFSSESPAPLPLLPSPPGTLSSSAAPLHDHGSNNGGLVSSSSSDHQNIQAAAVEPKGSNNGASGFVVGLAIGGILLLLLGVVFGILFVFCRRREKKKFGDYGSGRKHATSFTGYEEKGSLPQYTKQDSNNTQGLQSVINVSTPKGPIMDTGGNSPVTRGPTSGSGHALSSGTFTYEELLRATNGFSEQNLLGQGGFGYVFKGFLPNGKEVAVKQLKIGGHQGEREFRAEVETISQVHHKHLVSLVGYCISGSERLLIYEFVPNNTLEFHLHGEGQPVMDWPTRLKIAIGSAKGLAYLHEDCSPSIIHRDIKVANILLDFNFEAKVSDFGLAKIFSSSNPSITHMTTRVVGTFGYLAPEYASSGKVTDKSDIYSYGVMLLELITGRPPISNFGTAACGSLVNWARPLLAQAIGDGKFDTLADPKLQDDYDVDEMSSMVSCAAACVRLSAWRRPRMSQVVRSLEGNLSASELDDGIRPGQSSMHFPYESLDFDARNYMEDMKRMALTSNTTTPSRYSENTSEYGLLPSPSSTDTRQLNYSRG